MEVQSCYFCISSSLLLLSLVFTNCTVMSVCLQPDSYGVQLSGFFFAAKAANNTKSRCHATLGQSMLQSTFGAQFTNEQCFARQRHHSSYSYCWCSITHFHSPNLEHKPSETRTTLLPTTVMNNNGSSFQKSTQMSVFVTVDLVTTVSYE